MIDNTKNAEALQAYLVWLQAEMRKRLQQYFGVDNKETPDEILPPTWPDAPLTKFINSHELNKDEQLLLIMALAPHINAVFFEDVINEYLVDKGDFPLIGCVKGSQFRGLLPT